jgi:hypothetical protein
LKLHDLTEGKHYVAIVVVDHHKDQLPMVKKSASNEQFGTILSKIRTKFDI